MRKVLILAALMAAPAGAHLASPPPGLAEVHGGLWEIVGAPGGAARQCVSDVLKLAQFEHRTRNCSRTVSNKPGSSIVTYNCGPGDFGQSQVDVLTPRSLRVRTQGIADQMPFNYVFQARRVGDCGGTASSQRH